LRRTLDLRAKIVARRAEYREGAVSISVHADAHFMAGFAPHPPGGQCARRRDAGNDFAQV